ncbi:hypothetical protein CKO42_05805 [Lamprobacter modestohalophilus]|uniref:Uncharacterized protein n=2 Tax=Lamprobacter modestohalophilus TaxID=1064514 RepID=A0A9X0W6Z2_9GAMM|nr:hypothetical protein [Lamprobacter modestohalophilus]
MADDAVQLTAAEMDGVTAGAASGLVFNLIATGNALAASNIVANTSDTEIANIVVQLTSISQTLSFVGANGFSIAQ